VNEHWWITPLVSACTALVTVVIAVARWVAQQEREKVQYVKWEELKPHCHERAAQCHEMLDARRCVINQRVTDLDNRMASIDDRLASLNDKLDQLLLRQK
jgi:hypothetical protein